jgi:hypothetical protein
MMIEVTVQQEQSCSFAAEIFELLRKEDDRGRVDKYESSHEHDFMERTK